MATTPRDRLCREKDRVEAARDNGEMPREVGDTLIEYAVALDPAESTTRFEKNGEVKDYQPRTIEQYLRCLRITVDQGIDLLDTSVGEINDLMDSLREEEGLSKTTVVGYQSAIQTFYHYCDIAGVDPEAIETYNVRSPPRHDEHDMFSDEEVKALRRACRQSEMPVRNRALLELLIFTGQRLSALLTLRIADVEVDTETGPLGSRGYLFLNEEYDEEYGGLKGALRRGRKRPLFGANTYLRDWIASHPNGGDPDAWLFIGDPSHWKTNPADHWARPSADHVLRRIGKSAGVNKPVNAHNFRHYCATVLYRDYDVDQDDIRMLFGHKEGSNAIEETYSHLFDEEYIQKAEQALGYRQNGQQNALTPDVCPSCGESLKDHWWRCPSCQETFGPRTSSS